MKYYKLNTYGRSRIIRRQEVVVFYDPDLDFEVSSPFIFMPSFWQGKYYHLARSGHEGDVIIFPTITSGDPNVVCLRCVL